MLTRFDPFQEMLTLRNAVDRLFDSTYSPFETSNRPVAWGLPLDVVETDEAFVVKASLPGINPDELEITFTDNVLTIKGEIKEEDEEKETRYHLRERRYGSFARSITLGARLNGDKIQAAYHNGVLMLTLPKAEEIKPKRIAIKTDGKVLEAKVR